MQLGKLDASLSIVICDVHFALVASSSRVDCSWCEFQTVSHGVENAIYMLLMDLGLTESISQPLMA